jgi:hypothetical protein
MERHEHLDALIDGLSASVAKACATMERLTIQRDRLHILVLSGLEVFNGRVDDPTAAAWSKHARLVLGALQLPDPASVVTP